MWWCKTCVGLCDADFLVDGCLFVLYRFFEAFEGVGVGSGVVCFEDLDVFVCERCDLLLLFFVVRELEIMLAVVSEHLP